MTKDEKIRAYRRAISGVIIDAANDAEATGEISIDSINALRLLADHLDSIDPVNDYSAFMPVHPEEYGNEVHDNA